MINHKLEDWDIYLNIVSSVLVLKEYYETLLFQLLYNGELWEIEQEVLNISSVSFIFDFNI